MCLSNPAIVLIPLFILLFWLYLTVLYILVFSLIENRICSWVKVHLLNLLCRLSASHTKNSICYVFGISWGLELQSIVLLHYLFQYVYKCRWFFPYSVSCGYNPISSFHDNHTNTQSSFSSLGYYNNLWASLILIILI